MVARGHQTGGATQTMDRVNARRVKRTPADYLDYLVQNRHLDRLGADRAYEVQRQTREGIDVVLSQLGLINDEQILSTLAAFFELPVLAPHEMPSQPNAENAVPEAFVRQNGLVPLEMTSDALIIAISDPFATATVDAVRYFVERPVTVKLSSRRDIETLVARLYAPSDPGDSDAMLNGALSVDAEDIQRLKDMASEAPVVRFVGRILSSAVLRRASDVHIEPIGDAVRVRYRVDGLMTEVERLPIDMLSAVATRIKILGKLNIAERRLPQDGRTKFVVGGREIDIRVSATPTIHGESLVLRILDRSQVRLSLASLGFEPQLMDQLAQILQKPNGMLLVTGPTGSGKSTTLYAALSILNSVDRKIFSLEDPVEQILPGINQIPIKPEIGLDFLHCLRAILRQDPDVIMIGEMRDVETASTAVRASLTGHLVLSTLHTNSAAASITRLLDMGVEDYLLASSLQGILAQRLVRRLCSTCAEFDPNSGEVLESLGQFLPRNTFPVETVIKKPVGCSLCNGTGFFGRTTIGELICVTDEIRPHVRHGATEQEIAKFCRDRGMEGLHQNGLRKVLRGETTLTEVVRVAAG